MRARSATYLVLAAFFLGSLFSCRSEDPAAPVSLEITYPEPGEVVRKNGVRVQGTAAGVDRVEVNGEPAEVVGEVWEVLLDIPDGSATVTAVAGPETRSVEFTVDSRPPSLVLDSPERGQYVDASEATTVVVAGTVEEKGTGLQLVKIGEQIVDVADDGSFRHELALTPGINEVRVTALDRANNQSEIIRGVMHGEFVDPLSRVDPGFNIFLTSTGVADVEAVIETFVTPETVTQLVQQQFQNENAAVDAVRFDPLDFQVALTPGVIEVNLVVTNAQVEGSFTVGDDTYPTTVRIDRIGVELHLRPRVNAEGGLGIEVVYSALELDENDIYFDINGATEEDLRFLRNLVADLAQTAFGTALAMGIWDRLYDPNILKRRVVLLDREIVFHMAFNEVDIFPDGIVAKTRFEMPADRYPQVREVPGALSRLPGASAGSGATSDIQFTTTEYTIDRLMHGVWRSGLLHQELAGDDFNGVQLPFELNAASLATVLDSQVTTLVSPETPAGVRLRPMLPPVAVFDTEQSRLEIRLAEFYIDFLLLPEGQEPIVVATTSNFLDLGVDISIDGVLVNLDFDVALRSDLAEEPHFDLDDARTEQLLEDLVALVPMLVSQRLQLVGEADVDWLKLTRPDITVHGINEDWATVSLDIEPSTDL